MVRWSEEREGCGRAGRGVEEVAMGDRGSGRGRRGGEARSSRAAPVQTDARDWRRWCRVFLGGPWHASLSDCAVGRTGPGTGLLRVAALVGVFEL